MNLNSKTFEAQMRGFGKEVDEAYSKKLREATLQGYKTAIVMSRVDTGTFRLSWNVQLGSVNSAVREIPKTKPAKGSLPTSSEWQMSGVQQVTMQLKAGKAGSVYISNNLDYARMLNNMDGIVDAVNDNIEKVWNA